MGKIVETEEFSEHPKINQKVKTVATGLQKSICDLFKHFPTDKGKQLVADFKQSCVGQESIAVPTKRS